MRAGRLRQQCMVAGVEIVVAALTDRNFQRMLLDLSVEHPEQFLAERSAVATQHVFYCLQRESEIAQPNDETRPPDADR